MLRLRVMPPAVADVIRHEAYRAWRTLRRYGFQPQDVQQELVTHWHLQQHRYSADRGSEATFASRVCRHRALSIIEAAAATKRGGAHVCAVSEVPLTDDHGIEIERPEQVSADSQAIRLGLRSRPAAEVVDLKLDIATVLRKLPPGHAALARHLACGTVTSAAAALGIGRATAHRRRSTIKAAFLAAGLDGYLRPERSCGGVR